MTQGQKQDKWEPCPRCGSNRVQSRGGCFFFLLGFGLLGISIWLLFIPPVGITGIVLGIALIITSPLMRNVLQCQDCNKAWKYPAKKEQLKNDQSLPE